MSAFFVFPPKSQLLHTFYVNPVPKPRMTRRDKSGTSKKLGVRPCVARYLAYKDMLNWQRKSFKLPESHYHLIFYLPIPKSYSKSQKLHLHLKGHREKTPDKDNLEKAFLDALYKEDSCFWDGRVTKVWIDQPEGKIEVYDIGEYDEYQKIIL